jgi:hypothetical protein
MMMMRLIICVHWIQMAQDMTQWWGLVNEIMNFDVLQKQSLGSSGSIVSDYGLDDRAIEVRSPAEEKGFFL